MFDLDDQLRRWRLETEATLAFEPDEIDELEDHLKFAIETGLKEGLATEQAWNQALGRLGTAPSLALEFTKHKLLPALFHLLRSWWQAAILILIFSNLLFAFYYSTTGNYSWALVLGYLGVIAILVVLPGKPLKNTVLMAVGIAFCLIPLLHLLFYNALAEKIVGYGWIRMAAVFDWTHVALSLIGIILLQHK